MAEKISPEGYFYGSGPKSHHPFWEEVEVVEPLEITPTEEEQVITAPEGVIGYNPITVKPAAAEPFLETLNVTPSTEEQFIDAEDYEVDGWNIVDVAAVTAAIDPNIYMGNIKKDVSILGVTGTLVPANINENSEVLLIKITTETLLGLESQLYPITVYRPETGIVETLSSTGTQKDLAEWTIEERNPELTIRIGSRFAINIDDGVLQLNDSLYSNLKDDLRQFGAITYKIIKSGVGQTLYDYIIFILSTSNYAYDLRGFLVR